MFETAALAMGVGGSEWPQKRRTAGSPYLVAGLIRAMADRCRIMLGQPG
jgi:hypothetical protein